MSGWHRKRVDDGRHRTAAYRAAERQLRRLVESGQGFCWRCGGWIDPALRVRRGTRMLRSWHVGHDDADPTVIRGAEHERCNLRAAQRAAVRSAATTKVRL